MYRPDKGKNAIESETDNLPVREDHIWVSRKLIYGQAALLGISAATFFMLGMTVGNLTSSPGVGRSTETASMGSTAYTEDCRISGVVTVKKGEHEITDKGAVVVLLPRRSAPDKKQAPGLIMPETFVALDNPTIEAVHDAGGAVVRADSDGKFNVLVDQGRDYRLLILSKSLRSKGRQLTDQQSEMLGAWFAPAEKIIRDNDFLWREVESAGDEVDLGFITLE